jgi:hypothetical protein
VIAIAKGTLPYAVLVHLVNHPGQDDAEAIARVLLPAPKFTPPPPSMPVGERLRALYAHDAAAEIHRCEAAAKVARAIGRLVESGNVAPRRGPVLSPEFMALDASRGRRLAVEFCALEHGGKVRRRHLSLIARVVEFLPSTRESLVGKRPKRATQQAYADLVRWSVLIAPSQRVPTEAGVALVSQLKEVA